MSGQSLRLRRHSAVRYSRRTRNATPQLVLRTSPLRIPHHRCYRCAQAGRLDCREDPGRRQVRTAKNMGRPLEITTEYCHRSGCKTATIPISESRSTSWNCYVCWGGEQSSNSRHLIELGKGVFTIYWTPRQLDHGVQSLDGLRFIRIRCASESTILVVSSTESRRR